MGKRGPKKGSPQRGGRPANVWSLVEWKHIRDYIEKNNISMVLFAKYIGVTNSTFHNWKHGRCAPNTAIQQKIKDLIEGKTVPPKLVAADPALRAPGSRRRGVQAAILAKLRQAEDAPPAQTEPAETNGNGAPHAEAENPNAMAVATVVQGYLAHNKITSPEELDSLIQRVKTSLAVS